MKKFKNLFSKKTNLIIAIVALIECIILIGMTSFSWIETASSLVIKGDTLWVTDGRNYEYKYSDSTKQLVDLSSYFINSDHFSFAKASTSNAKDFYFPYNVNGSTEYRQGDTTDYNVTYYNFDFDARSTAQSANFFFNSDEMFSFADTKFTNALGEEVSVSETDMTNFLNAFRIAVTVGNTTTIYSKTGTSYTAYGGTTVTPTAFSTACYAKDKTENMLFTSGSSNSGVNVNFKIWLEEQDEGVKNNPSKEALLGATVNIDMKLVSQELAFKGLTFNDYSLSTKSDDTRDMVYYYNDGTYYPMVKTYTSSTVFTWVTSDNSGTPSDTIPSDLDLNRGSFVFGHRKGTDFETIYTWNLGFTDVSDTFNAISVTKTSENETQGYGYWKGVDLTRVKFIDRTTYAGEERFNANASKFIATDKIYVVGDNKAIKLNYFADIDAYAAYIPTTWLDNDLPFVYTSTDYYSADTVDVSWSAPVNTESTTYTALGYSEEKKLSDLSKANGVGTCGAVERINLSAELVDTVILAQGDELFRVGFDSQTLYMASDPHNPLSYFAYVPAEKSLTFDYGEMGVNSKISWDAGAIGNSSSTYYLTSLDSDKHDGLWNLAVVVDGTVDNLIDDTLSNANDTGASLTYTVENASAQDMTKVDNFRWRTGDLTDMNLIKFTWTAYSETKGYVDTVFDYNVDSEIDGIYYLTVTEDGTVIKVNTN